MSSDTAVTDKPPSSETLLDAAINAESTSQLDEALWQASNDLDSYEGFAISALRYAVRSGSQVLAAHLLSSEGVPVSAVGPEFVAGNPSIPLLETLLAYGWDLDQASPKDAQHKGRRLIDRVIMDDELVTWLIEHGAKVDGGEEEWEYEPRPPLLLETCAALGSVTLFKLLQSAGAKVGKRILHRAVGEAAAIGADPRTTKGGEEKKLRAKEDDSNRHKTNREEMLRYLVDDLKLDVNALDCEVAKPNHEGTPLGYAVRCRDGAAVVRWLLEKGADPSIKDVGGVGPKQKAQALGLFDIVAILDR